MVQQFLHQNLPKLKFDENQKSGPQQHQDQENQNNRQKINFVQNFCENDFWEPDF